MFSKFQTAVATQFAGADLKALPADELRRMIEAL